MNGSHHFICYSTKDAGDFSLRLHDELTAGPPPFKVWLDKRRLHAGFDWDSQLVEALRKSETLLFVISPDSVDELSPCKEEWTRALSYKKPVVPLLLKSESEIPFGLGRRQHIDFTHNFDVGLAQLRLHLRWLSSSDGELQTLKYRLQDASRDLRRAASDSDRQRIEAEIDLLKIEIQRIEQVVARPEDSARRVEESIQRGLEREREQPTRPAERTRRTRFVNPPPGVAPNYFQDRLIETQVLAEFLKDRAARMMTVVGRGGVGKTAVVCRLLDALQSGHLPDTKEKMEVDGIVYLSAAGSRRISFPNIFEDLCQMLQPDALPALAAIYKSGQSAAGKMGALLDRFPSGCHVLLLDNFENVLDAGTGQILDLELDAALRVIITHQPHGVRVIITTRVRPVDLLIIGPGRQSVLALDEGLESPFAEKVLREMDWDAALGLKNAPDAKLRKLRERVRGYPRALEAIYAILAADRVATLDELLANTAQLPENVVEVLIGEAFNRLDPAAEQVMKALAVYGNPVPPTAIDYLLQPFTPGVNSSPVLRRLVNMHFVRRESNRYYLHPVDRHYALGRIPVGSEADRDLWDPPFSQFALRNRAGNFYREVRKPAIEWRTIHDIAPQLSEFDLRADGGDWETTLQILHDLADDYLIRWGHYGLCIEMAARLQNQLVEKRDELNRLQILATAHLVGGGARQAAILWEQIHKLAKEVWDEFTEWRAVGNLAACRESLGEYRASLGTYRRMLNYARRISADQWEGASHNRIGLTFRSLGKIRYAIKHLTASLHIAQEMSDSHGVEGDWHNLGSCYFDLGEIAKAREHYERALEMSPESGDRNWQANHVSGLGSCCSIIGDTDGAERHHRTALQLRRDIGHRLNEASSLGALAECAARRGETTRALEFHRDALAIAQEFDSGVDVQRFREGLVLLLLDTGDFNAAVREAQSAVQLGEQFRTPLATANCRLALAALISGTIEVAQKAADETLRYNVPLENSRSAAMRGLVALRTSNVIAARSNFTQAVVEADKLLARTPELFGQLDLKAFALCGMALCGSSRHVVEAESAYRAGRAINRDVGVVNRVLRIFDQIAVLDHDELLGQMRAAASGL